MRMLLQEGGGDGFRDRAFHGLGHDAGLVFAPGHEHQLLGAQDGAHPHGDGEVRHVFLTAEVARRILAGDAVQRDAPGERFAARSGFIETDVTRASDAQDLQVNAAHRINRLFVLPAMGEDLVRCDRALGDVDVFLGNVDVIEQLVCHEAAIAFRVVPLQAVVLIQVEGDDVLEAQALLLVQADQLAIKGHRGGPCGHPKHGREAGLVLGLNDLPDFTGQFSGGGGRVGEDNSGDFFECFGGRSAREHEWVMWIVDSGRWIMDWFWSIPQSQACPPFKQKGGVFRAYYTPGGHHGRRFPMQYGGNRAVLIIKFGFFDL